MKKFYTTLLSAIVAVTASAEMPLLQKGNMDDAAVDQMQIVCNIGKASPTATKAKISQQDAAARKAPVMKIFEEDKWESMGTGKLTEFVMSAIWGIDATVIDVEVEKSTTTEGVYRIAEPYKNYTLPSGLVNSGVKYDATKATPMYIVVEGSSFIVMDFDMGISDEDGDYAVTTQIASNYPKYSVATIANAYPTGVGTYNAGLLTYPATMESGGKNYSNFLVSIGNPSDGYYAANDQGQFKILFPGAEAKDYSISINAPTVADNNDFTLKITLGADVAKYKAAILPGDYPASNANLQIIFKNGTEFPATTKSLKYDASEEDGCVTILAVTVDANGNMQEGSRAIFYAVQQRADEWEVCAEKAKYADGILTTAYSDAPTEEYDVTIESSKQYPGYFRLVNVFSGTYPLAQYNFYTGTANQYIYIDATNPEQVYLEESPVGFEQKEGQFIINSQANRYMLAGQEVPQEL